MKLAAAVLFAALPLAAQAPEVAHCLELRHHGDAGTRACYQNLTRSREPGIQAEGFWGLRDYKSANDAFRAAVKLHDKDPNLRVRWGRMYLEHWQPADAGALFQEALEIDKMYAPALLGMAMVAADSFDSRGAQFAERALQSDPKLVEARELLARMALEDNNNEKAADEAKKALAMSGEALDAMAILATIDWMDDKTSTPWIDRVLKINPTYGEAYATRCTLFRHQSPLQRSHPVLPQGARAGSYDASRAQRARHRADALGRRNRGPAAARTGL